MDFVVTPVGFATFALIAALYVMFAKTLALGALSLPCVTLLTSAVYFYVIPLLAFSDGEAVFLDVSLHSLEWVHVAVVLYSLGAAIACFLGRRHLLVDPALRRPNDPPISQLAFWVVAILAAGGIAILVASGRLNLTNDENFVASSEVNALKFIQLSISMLVPVTVVYAVRNNFNSRALAVISFVIFVILATGFRYRIAILLVALAGSYLIMRRLRFGVLTTAFGAAGAIIIFNAIGRVRSYGTGFDLSNLAGVSIVQLLHSFGGEVGPIFALYSVTEYPPSELIGVEPWLVALGRLVPTLLWPDKPTPVYLLLTLAAFDQKAQLYAGIAPPQHAEMLIQFGWWGLPVLAFLYFTIIIRISAQLNRQSREVRIAGATILPGLFGFYMQQRGYFFQNLIEAIFMVGPLFLMSSRLRRITKGRRASRTGCEYPL